MPPDLGIVSSLSFKSWIKCHHLAQLSWPPSLEETPGLSLSHALVLFVSWYSPLWEAIPLICPATCLLVISSHIPELRILSCSPVYPQHLEPCLTYGEHSIEACWMNKQMNVSLGKMSRLRWRSREWQILLRTKEEK
jgi:hypothetical protein